MNLSPVLVRGLLVLGLVACASPPQESQERAGEPSRADRLADLGLLYDDTIVTQSARTVDFNGQALVPRYIYTDLDQGDRKLTVQVAATRVVFGLDGNCKLIHCDPMPTRLRIHRSPTVSLSKHRTLVSNDWVNTANWGFPLPGRVRRIEVGLRHL